MRRRSLARPDLTLDGRGIAPGPRVTVVVRTASAIQSIGAIEAEQLVVRPLVAEEVVVMPGTDDIIGALVPMDGVVPGISADEVRVIVAVDRVASVIALDRIGASTAFDRVRPRTTADQICTGLPVQPVVPRAPTDGVVAASSSDRVVPTRPRNPSEVPSPVMTSLPAVPV